MVVSGVVGRFVVLVQAGLNFVNDAKIADKLRGMGIGQMRLAIHVTGNVGRGKVRELRLAPERCQRRPRRIASEAAIETAL